MLIGCQLKYFFNYYFEPKGYTKAIIIYFFLSHLENSYRQSSRTVVNNLGALWEILS